MSPTFPEPSLSVLVTQLATQALLQLGEAPNPLTGVAEVSLPRAAFTIDLLRVLEDKTRGNLDPAEQELLEATLDRLKQRYAEKA